MHSDILNQLPPMRELQHAIDLIPSSTLPKFPHYCMSLIENEELSRQIQQCWTKALFENAFATVLSRFYLHKERMLVGEYVLIA